MQIRRYIPGEEGAIWAVYFGSTRNVVAKDYTLDQVQRWAPESPDWESWAGELARTNPFVAIINGQLVGFAELESEGHISNFYCHHEFQRQGIGTALFRALEQEAIRLGLPALFAEVSTTGSGFSSLRDLTLRRNAATSCAMRQRGSLSFGKSSFTRTPGLLN